MNDLDTLIANLRFMPCSEGCGAQTPARLLQSGQYVSQACADCSSKEEREADARYAVARAADSVPRSYRWATLESPELAERVHDGAAAIARARLALADSRVVLIGPAGSGKTSLAVALLRARARLMAKPGIFVHAFRLGVARIQHRPGDGEPSIVEEAMTSELALIDDIGSERQTANNAVPDVVFERHAEKLATIITTPFEADQIATTYGDGVARRIFEGAAIIRLGESHP